MGFSYRLRWGSIGQILPSPNPASELIGWLIITELLDITNLTTDRTGDFIE
ncbi:unnamed protein product, partial [marine sediment metagenome]